MLLQEIFNLTETLTEPEPDCYKMQQWVSDNQSMIASTTVNIVASKSMVIPFYKVTADLWKSIQANPSKYMCLYVDQDEEQSAFVEKSNLRKAPISIEQLFDGDSSSAGFGDYYEEDDERLYTEVEKLGGKLGKRWASRQPESGQIFIKISGGFLVITTRND